MKKAFVLTTVLAAALLAPAASAQTVQDQIALSRAEIQTERQAIVAQTLGLTEAQSALFWPLYKQYRAELDKPLDRAWNLFTTYGDKWDSMNDKDAATMLDQWLAVEKDMASIKQKWARKMAKTLGGTTAMRFFQADNKLDTIIRLEAAADIPLVTNNP